MLNTNQSLVIDNGSYSVKMGSSSMDRPLIMPNCIMRTKDKKIYLADQIENIQDISQVQVRRPFESGQLTSWDLQKLIWDYSFDSLKLSSKLSDFNLVLTETLFQLPQLSKQTDQIVFEEYEFSAYYKTCPLALVPWNVEMNNSIFGDSVDVKETPYNDFQLIIDSGFNCTWVIPMVQGLIYWKGVKRLNIAGRVLNGLLREMISFRYYDVTEETILVNNIKEKACFVAEDYNATIDNITKLRRGQSHQDLVLEYVLPDFKTTTKGYVLDRKSQSVHDDLQILKLYDERISIPELMFHPEVGQLDKAGLIQTIISSIRSCPELIQPLLSSNIVLIGGNFKIPGFQKRILNNLKSNLPQDWDIRVGIDAENVREYAWLAGREFANSGDVGFNKVCITRQEYLENGANILRKFVPRTDL